MESKEDVNLLPYNRILEKEVKHQLNGKLVYVNPTDEKRRLIIKLLEHKKTSVRWRAADMLGKLREGRAVQGLCKALNDHDWLVRLHAAKALGRIGDPAAVRGLITRLEDGCPYVRRRAALSLCGFEISEEKHAIVRLLYDQDMQVRWVAANHLMKLKDTTLFPQLLEALETENEDIVHTACSVLGQYGRDAAVLLPELENLLRQMDNPKNRFWIIGLLGRCEARGVRRILRIYTHDPDADVRSYANTQLKYLNWRGERKYEYFSRKSISQQNLRNFANRVSDRSNSFRDRGKILRAFILQFFARWLRWAMRDSRGVAVSDNQLAILYRTIQIFSLARWKSKAAVKFFRSIGDYKNLPSALMTQANIWLQLNRFENALDCYREANEIFEELQMPSGMAGCLGGRARIDYLYLKDFEHAKVLLNEAIVLRKRSGEHYLGVEYDNMGDVYGLEEKWKTALVWYQRALEMHDLYCQKYVPMCKRKIKKIERKLSR